MIPLPVRSVRNVSIFNPFKCSFSSNCHPTHITVNDKISEWRKLGFVIPECGCLKVGEIKVNLQQELFPFKDRGILDWGFSSIPSNLTDIDGIPVETNSCSCDREETSHPNGVNSVDHIVLKTSNWQKVDKILSEIGILSRKVRVDEKKGITFVFYRPSKTIIEMICPTDQNIMEPSALWGITFASTDIDLTHSVLSGCTKEPWKAVQPGRRITTLVAGKHDISIPVAFISPHVKA